MSRAQAWLQHVSNVLVGATGVAYFVMKHLLTSDDPFAVANHPLQPAVQHLHVLAGPLLVFAVGVLWTRHVGPGATRTGAPRRRSGLLLAAGFAPMAASGYLLQISTEAPWRTIWLWVHVAAGALWVLSYATHAARPLLAAWRRWSAGAAVTDGAVAGGVVVERAER